MKHLWQLSTVALLALALAGCFNGSGGLGSVATKLDFTTFVKAQINNPTVNRDPVSINNKEFVFNDRNNEQAYADLF